MANPALFKIGVFGIIGRIEKNEVKILVNLRADQARQKKLLGLPADWDGVIVDLPGGTVNRTDRTLGSALIREIAEECGIPRKKIEIVSEPIKVAPLITPTKRDIAICWAVILKDDPRSTDEAIYHLWVSPRDLRRRKIIFPSRVKNGRMRQMAQAGINWWSKKQKT